MMYSLTLAVTLSLFPPRLLVAPEQADPFATSQIVTRGPDDEYRQKLNKIEGLIPSLKQAKEMTASSLAARMELVAGQADNIWEKLETDHFADPRMRTDAEFRRQAERDWRWKLYLKALVLAASGHRGGCDPTNPNGLSMTDHCGMLLIVWTKPALDTTPGWAPWNVWVIEKEFETGNLEAYYAYAIRKYQWSAPGAGQMYFSLLSSACEKGHHAACEYIDPSEKRAKEAADVVWRHHERNQ